MCKAIRNIRQQNAHGKINPGLFVANSSSGARMCERERAKIDTRLRNGEPGGRDRMISNYGQPISI